ncbi:MAG: DTW domain-containing protein, partial [Pseudomonadota bacterium]
AALAQLEADAQKYQPLLAAFDGFVAQQMGYRSSRAA